MIGRRQLPELKTFAQIEQQLTFRQAPQFAMLVVPNGNATTPVHRWFHYKEAFSASLLETLIGSGGLRWPVDRPLVMLDPYCGIGTGLLSAQLSGRNIKAIGIDCNPFSVSIAAAKLRWHKINVRRFRKLAATLLTTRFRVEPPVPELTSIKTGRCITIHMARQIVQFRNAIMKLRAGPERDALMVGVAATVEPVSRVRRDGRALRIVAKTRTTLRKVLSDKWQMIADDADLLQKAGAKAGKAAVFTGDGRYPAGVGIRPASVDLVLTSPPYPNNIDYNEVYKLEMWLLGHVESAEQFLALRKKTFRSHPTCSPLLNTSHGAKAFKEFIGADWFNEFMGPVLSRVEALEGNGRQRTKVLKGYIFDTWLSLRSHYACLRPGGRAVYVVGNSLHGGVDAPYLIPTDLLFSKIGQALGFELEELSVARGLPRRLAGNHFLRDSVVQLRKPV